MKLFSSCFTLFIVQWLLGSHQVFKATWSEELSDNYTATIYFYCNNGRRNCGYYMRLNQAMRQRFPKHRHAKLWVSRGLGSTPRLDHHLLAWHGCWLVCISERKILFLARSMWKNVPFWICSNNQELLVSSITGILRNIAIMY